MGWAMGEIVRSGHVYLTTIMLIGMGTLALRHQKRDFSGIDWQVLN